MRKGDGTDQDASEREYLVLAGSRWRRVRVRGAGTAAATMSFRLAGRRVTIPGAAPNRYPAYDKAVVTLLVDDYIRRLRSDEAMRAIAQERGYVLRFAE